MEKGGVKKIHTPPVAGRRSRVASHDSNKGLLPMQQLPLHHTDGIHVKIHIGQFPVF